LVARGEACDGADLAYTGLAHFTRAQGELDDEILMYQVEVGRGIDRPDGVPGEDWEDSAEFFNAMLPFWTAQRHFERGLATAVSAAAGAQSLCDAETGPAWVSGTVSYYDPNARILKFESGEVVGVAAEFEMRDDPSGDPASLDTGIQIEAEGIGFTDGSMMVKRATPSVPRGG
jgi:hypothetical protein